MEELKEKYKKLILWFFALLVFFALFAHSSLEELVNETNAQEENAQLVKILQAVQEQEQNQTQKSEVQEQNVVNDENPIQPNEEANIEPLDEVKGTNLEQEIILENNPE